jgi:hypothetical protein
MHSSPWARNWTPPPGGIYGIFFLCCLHLYHTKMKSSCLPPINYLKLPKVKKKKDFSIAQCNNENSYKDGGRDTFNDTVSTLSYQMWNVECGINGKVMDHSTFWYQHVPHICTYDVIARHYDVITRSNYMNFHWIVGEIS